ncbi:hypothetical protein D3C72_1514190 [compost metagenome]
MAGHDVRLGIRQGPDARIALQHIAQVEDGGKRIAVGVVAVVVQGVGRQHHPPARGVHAHHLQAGRVAADAVELQPRRQRRVAVMEAHAPGVHLAHHRLDVVHREKMPHRFEAHVAAGGVVHFGLLQVDAGVGVGLDIAGMVVVQVGQDQVADVAGRQPQPGQRRVGRQRERPVAGACRAGAESRVDQHIARRTPQQPAIEVHGHRLVVDIRARQEIVGRAPRHAGVADRVGLVGGQAARRLRRGRHCLTSLHWLSDRGMNAWSPGTVLTIL